MRNAEQAEHWGGAQGHHWVAEAARYRDMLGPFGGRVVSALAPAEGERIIDVGCGNGDLSLTIAGIVGPTGEVLGVDLSAPMLANAKQRAAAEKRDNVCFENADAQNDTRQATLRPDAWAPRIGYETSPSRGRPSRHSSAPAPTETGRKWSFRFKRSEPRLAR